MHIFRPEKESLDVQRRKQERAWRLFMEPCRKKKLDAYTKAVESDLGKSQEGLLRGGGRGSGASDKEDVDLDNVNLGDGLCNGDYIPLANFQSGDW